MSVYVMSDLHGCSKQFDEMLEKIGFCEQDHLYIIGDAIDRGPSGVAILRKIMNSENMTFIMGNHELMLLDAVVNGNYFNWDNNHNEYTLNALKQLDEKELERLLMWLLHAPYFLDVEVNGRSFELVHACPKALAADETDMVWSRDDAEQFGSPEKTVIFGHTPTVSILPPCEPGRIIHYTHAANIDCGCVYFDYYGRLGCLRLDDMEEFYVSVIPFD